MIFLLRKKKSLPKQNYYSKNLKPVCFHLLRDLELFAGVRVHLFDVNISHPMLALNTPPWMRCASKPPVPILDLQHPILVQLVEDVADQEFLPSDAERRAFGRPAAVTSHDSFTLPPTRFEPPPQVGQVCIVETPRVTLQLLDLEQLVLVQLVGDVIGQEFLPFDATGHVLGSPVIVVVHEDFTSPPTRF
jgi:hypothetical protein